MTVSRNVAMFGFEDLDGFVSSIKESPTYQVDGMNGVIMSLLSDAQEEMSLGDTETARQIINSVKYLLSLKDTHEKT